MHVEATPARAHLHPGEPAHECARSHAHSSSSVAQGVLELVKRGFLTALTKRAKRAAITIGLGPDRRDGQKLLVQSSGTGTVDCQATDHHNAWLRARSKHDAETR